MPCARGQIFRLNRTSVGLKLLVGPADTVASLGLNRTSVGLKRASTRRRRTACPGLNRTSVGLKRSYDAGTAYLVTVPQSNQRGIETKLSGVVGLGEVVASIEPAWD